MRRAAGEWLVLALGIALFFVPALEGSGAPQIGSAWTSGVSESGATLNAEVGPNGFATNYHFDYLTEAAYQANLGTGKDGFAGALKAPPGADPSIAPGMALVTVARAIGSLSPDTAYRYRVQAINAEGASFGSPRVFTTSPLGSNSFLLDGRAWEMVSPTDKNGGEVQGPGRVFGGGVFQAAVSGSVLTYSSTHSFGGGAPGAPSGSQYLARRGDDGWANENVTAPTAAGAYGSDPDGVPFQLFSTDLARALMLNGRVCAVGEPCARSYSLRESSSGALTPSVEEPDLRFVAASADLSWRVLSTCAALTPDAIEVPGPEGCDPAQPNLYRWSASGLDLINLLPAAGFGTPGASLAAQAGALSADGGRAYFTHAGDLYLREGAATKQVDGSLGGGGVFETASTSGAVAFITRAGHLYRYEAAGAGSTTDLTPAGGVQGVLGASAGGDYVYYLAADGLFVRHGAAAPVEVADAADASNYPPATGTARVTPDGTHVAFLSSAPLTGHDNRLTGPPPALVGVPQPEVFLYDATTATLLCASCNPAGERPLGPSAIPGATANGEAPTATHSYKPRALSDDGRRLFFDSADDLALRDRDRSPPRPDPDVYEWEAQGSGSCQRPGGCLALISNGRSLTGAFFLDASPSGDDVFFLTADSLVGADSGFADVYDAREGGGFPEAFKPIACIGDACQPLPSEPEDPQPSTLVPSPGNPPLLVSAPLRCKKGFVKKRGRCVRKAKKRRLVTTRLVRSGTDSALGTPW
ncbi:MAG TPA: hypothetical protein VGO66_04955 [Solirubrobacterales bacterium]|nr:hypothetical protein [Solirubrobacterales bacterium]